MFSPNIMYIGSRGISQHPPFKINIVLDVSQSSPMSSQNRNGYASCMLLSNSQVASSGPRCFHCTFTCHMERFQRLISLFSRIQSSSTRRSPSDFSYMTFQSITWVASWTYFFKIETWNTLCILKFGGKASWYATSPTLARTSNGPQYLGANLAQLPNLKELFLGLTLTNTWSPVTNSLRVLFLSALLFCWSWAIFKLLCTYFNVSSISFNISGPIISLSKGLLHEIEVLHFLL